MIYLYRLGDGNDGCYPQYYIETDRPYAYIKAAVCNRYIVGSKHRRHIKKYISVDGDEVIYATVYEGPNGERPFDAAWICAELVPEEPCRNLPVYNEDHLDGPARRMLNA